LLVQELQDILKNNCKALNHEFKRVFHGRGGLYRGYEFLTIDSIDTILYVAFYKEVEKSLEVELLEMLQSFILTSQHQTIVLQRRYIPKTTAKVIVGRLDDEVYGVENGVKIKLDLLSNQNSGYFPDMKIGREFILNSANGKNILNLFSYTCAFSLFAIKGGAKSVVNIDMSKGALTKGRTNHHINNLETKNVSFFPYNILKSFSRIKKYAPYDIIIIDPPSFQKGSFEATKDYGKIIKKLPLIASKNSIVLACLNAPQLDQQFIIDIFDEFAPQFRFVKRLENLREFKSKDENRTLKNLVFQNY
jgi:23S rRNA (cytosine1962-C5)-methyltransferase